MQDKSSPATATHTEHPLSVKMREWFESKNLRLTVETVVLELLSDDRASFKSHITLDKSLLDDDGKGLRIEVALLLHSPVMAMGTSPDLVKVITTMIGCPELYVAKASVPVASTVGDPYSAWRPPVGWVPEKEATRRQGGVSAFGAAGRGVGSRRNPGNKGRSKGANPFKKDDESLHAESAVNRAPPSGGFRDLPQALHKVFGETVAEFRSTWPKNRQPRPSDFQLQRILADPIQELSANPKALRAIHEILGPSLPLARYPEQLRKKLG